MFNFDKRGLFVRGPARVGKVAGSPWEETARTGGGRRGREVGPEHGVVRSHVPVLE